MATYLTIPGTAPDDQRNALLDFVVASSAREIAAISGPENCVGMGGAQKPLTLIYELTAGLPDSDKDALRSKGAIISAADPMNNPELIEQYRNLTPS